MRGMPKTFTLRPEDVFRKKGEVVFRDIGGESLLIPIVNNVGDLSSIYTLNEIAARIWGLIDGRRSVREITRLLTDEYDVSEDVVMDDVSGFIEELVNIRFLERV